MPDLLQHRINDLAQAFRSGTIADAAPQYASQLTAFGENGVLQLDGPAAIARAIKDHREAAYDHGLQNFSGQVFAQSLNRTGRFMFHVRWLYEMGDHAPQRVAETAYYCDTAYGAAKIEMIELRRLAFQDAMSWYDAQNVYHAPNDKRMSGTWR